MQIPKEHKPFFLEELIAMRWSISLMLLLAGLFIATIVFICLGHLPLFNSIFLPIFVFLFRKSRWSFLIYQGRLQLKRYFMEPEYAKIIENEMAESET
jgi:hypothetical protein